jgi:hypothetical protein
VRGAIALAGVVVAALAASVAVAASSPPYRAVAHLAGVPIEAPNKSQSWGVCPAGALTISAPEMRNAKHVVLAALPALAKRATPHLHLKDARVTLVSHTRRSGFIMPWRRACWGRPFHRSVLVETVLPAERRSTALTGNPWFYVARTRHAWVIWDQPH